MVSVRKPVLGTLVLPASRASNRVGNVKHRRRDIDILIVEDDPELRRDLALSLDEHGFSLEVAADGQEALDRLRYTCRPQVVLLDLSMPRMDGGDLLANMERDPEWCTLRVVVMTGTIEGVLAHALQLGGICVLEKPFGIDELLASIEKVRFSGHGALSIARGARPR
jgi:CheY-like chemotaxis protein